MTNNNDTFTTDKATYNLKDEKLSFSTSRITQGATLFYTLTMPSDILSSTSFVIKRTDDGENGFQRYLDHNKAMEIAKYIDASGTIPTSIILSAQPEAELTIDRNKTLRFKPSANSFLILDGQHRIWGFNLANSLIRVPVVIYNSLSRRI